jgi:hypothetical protein
MSNAPESPPKLSRDDLHVRELARKTHSPRELANRIAGSSEETAALFDSGYRQQSELGIDPRQDAP